MEIYLNLDQKRDEQPFSFSCTRMVNAGYVGRNQKEVNRHIKELAEQGIPGPISTPTLYPMAVRELIIAPKIEVLCHKTSGEVEYVLLIKDEHTIYVGVGSDHTDRQLEVTDIPRAKQICPNVLYPIVWPLNEVEEHWDNLIMRSKTVRNSKTILCQEGYLKSLLNPRSLMAFVRSKVTGTLNGMIIFSGTLGALTKEIVFGERFIINLEDPKLNRYLKFEYDICTLDYIGKY